MLSLRSWRDAGIDAAGPPALGGARARRRRPSDEDPARNVPAPRRRPGSKRAGTPRSRRPTRRSRPVTFPPGRGPAQRVRGRAAGLDEPVLLRSTRHRGERLRRYGAPCHNLALALPRPAERLGRRVPPTLRENVRHARRDARGSKGRVVGGRTPPWAPWGRWSYGERGNLAPLVVAGVEQHIRRVSQVDDVDGRAQMVGGDSVRAAAGSVGADDELARPRSEPFGKRSHSARRPR